jgi:hypothetical protein
MSYCKENKQILLVIGQIGLIWAVLKLFSKLTAITPAKDNFLYQFSTTYPN